MINRTLNELVRACAAAIKRGASAKALAHLEAFYQQSVGDPWCSELRLKTMSGWWIKLSRIYSPAMQSLIRFRDSLAKTCLHEEFPVTVFQELAEFNHLLPDERNTADVFCSLKARRPDKAKAIYSLAEQSLLQCGLFDVCIDFVNVEERLTWVEDACRAHTGFSFATPIFSYAMKILYMERVLRIVKLLYEQKDESDAEKVRDRALKIFGDDIFRDLLQEVRHCPVPSLSEITARCSAWI